MKKSILEIYALAVCFVTVVCFIVSLGIAGYSIVEISKPDFTMSASEYTQHQDNEIFWNTDEYGRVNPYEKKEKIRPSEVELSKLRTASYQRALANEQRSGAQALVKCLIVLLIDSLVFFLHWVVARRARTNPN